MTPVTTITAILVALLATAPQEGRGQWRKKDCKEYALEELDAGLIPADAPAFVDCKYAQYLDPRLQDLASSIQLIVKGWDPSETIRALSRGDNIRIYGVFVGQEGKPRGTFHVYDLERLPPDDQQFGRLRAKLKEGDIQGRLDLGDWAKRRYKMYPSWAEPLNAKSKEMYEEAVQLLETGVGEDDYDTHLRVAKIYLYQMEDRRRALEKLKKTCLVLRPDDPDLVKLLTEELRAISYRRAWVLYEEFKQAEGFVQREKDGTWIPEPIARLEAFAEVADQLTPPRLLRGGEETFEIEARAARAVKGMTKYYVTRAIGYPQDALALDNLEIWVYPGAYLYFKDGILWKDPEKR